MRLALDVLGRAIDLPEGPREVRQLLDLAGVEVKREEADPVATVFTVELLANRGDHYCYDGIAQELNGRLGTGVRKPAWAALEVGEAPCPLRCETDLCLRYTATALERGEAPATPLAAPALRVLEAAGVHSLEPPVDATNVANLELGQPTHAFDADKIAGPITIRLSVPGERARPLFAEEDVELPVGTLVIADDEKILAIAGVIGCESSKTTAETRRLILESATFDPVAVRKASRALGIHTDSSARFERGADPERALVGAGRVVALLEAGTGWQRVGTTGLVGAWQDPQRVIAIDSTAANRFLHTQMDPAEVTERLERYGFGVESDGAKLAVTVPSWRLWDVERPADLYEELAKSVGYEQIPTELPAVALGAPPSEAELRRDRVEEVLLGHGFYEVYTDGFYGRRAIEQLGLTEADPLFAHVETTNSIDKAYSLLKNNCLHQALEAVAVNERRRTLRGRMYEWTRTFHPRADVPAAPDPAAPVCEERFVLWLTTFSDRVPDTWRPGADEGLWFVKGLVDELALELGLPLQVGPPPPDHPLAARLHPGRSAGITLHGEVVGIFGEAHPAVARRYKLKAVRATYLELDQAILLGPGARPAYVEPPSVQPIVRSLAFEVPPGIEAGEVEAVLASAGPRWLERIDVTDVFVADRGSDSEIRSITFELVYANPENVRSADEVNEATERLVGAVEQALGPRGVKQR